MTRPVEIVLPEQASATAHAVVPETAVPRVAAALRATRRDTTDGRDDATYVADCVMEYLRDAVTRWSHRERIAQALHAAEPPEVGW